MTTTREALIARYSELTTEADAIKAASAPLRAARDDLKRQHALELSARNSAIREAEEGLFDIERERAQLAIALGGKVLG